VIQSATPQPPDLIAEFGDIWVLSLNGDDVLDYLFHRNESPLLGHAAGMLAWASFEFTVDLTLICGFWIADDERGWSEDVYPTGYFAGTLSCFPVVKRMEAGNGTQ
jgi:hypothetical protein